MKRGAGHGRGEESITGALHHPRGQRGWRRLKACLDSAASRSMASPAPRQCVVADCYFWRQYRQMAIAKPLHDGVASVALSRYFSRGLFYLENRR